MSCNTTFMSRLLGATQKEHAGTVFSAIPEVQDHRPVLLVLVADHGKVRAYHYDLRSGRSVR